MGNIKARKQLEVEFTAKCMFGTLTDNDVANLASTISTDLSDAINPVGFTSAPFLVALLETYAAAIRDMYPDVGPAVDDIKKMDSVQIRMPVNEERRF